MRTKILAIFSALVLSVGMSGVSFAADTCKGKVKAIEGSTVVVDCNGKEMKITADDAASYEVGDAVECTDGKIKKGKKKVEGC